MSDDLPVPLVSSLRSQPREDLERDLLAHVLVDRREDAPGAAAADGSEESIRTEPIAGEVHRLVRGIYLMRLRRHQPAAATAVSRLPSRFHRRKLAPRSPEGPTR
ncbi:hypothetical protein WMF28_01585 [Sorangium sp. So ce590]|uniref:hypothetical protein n=1 Tax=Sorangium sp. So ce590 TaxID=3133317 RepID=UPI003F61CB29